MQENADIEQNSTEDQAPQNTDQLQSEDSNNNQENSSSNDRFTDGETIKLVRVRFPGNSKSFPFLVGKRNFMYGQKVMAMSDRGMTVGYINSLPYDVTFEKSMLPLKSISKEATQEDVDEQRSYYLKEKEAERYCIKLIEKHKLSMNITHVEFIQFGKKAVFYFNAPARVDFRDLVKDLVGELKMRIELRQISVRDRAAAIGAVGVCGLQTCCSSFLKNYGNVSIKMAKNQNLALIPSKINGICGQIKCCIRYEDDVYSQKRSLLPKEGTYQKVANGDIGRVQKLHLLVEQFDMITDKGEIRRYSVNQFSKENGRPPKTWTFPKELRHIVNETSTVIGLTDEEQKKSEEFLKKYNEGHDKEIHEVLLDEASDDEDTKELDSIEKEMTPKKKPHNKRPNNRNKKPMAATGTNQKAKHKNNVNNEAKDGDRPQKKRNNRRPQNKNRPKKEQ
ncbi:regulatory iron-sulfur-containing complex subunit RicT [Halobacteriovorax sp. HLS]|uniref:PSP1 domain-containing protein n=1 Tax=Halobacteriovorax sp. HLS TaxID=2234000 RepID=UPI000FD72086|nr:regulatory iron-sulfur-containing complex subunit RicT [Halobacteriovorax sp. HLS]